MITVHNLLYSSITPRARLKPFFDGFSFGEFGDGLSALPQSLAFCAVIFSGIATRADEDGIGGEEEEY